MTLSAYALLAKSLALASSPFAIVIWNASYHSLATLASVMFFFQKSEKLVRVVETIQRGRYNGRSTPKNCIKASNFLVSTVGLMA
jgi:hypothetical protein